MISEENSRTAIARTYARRANELEKSLRAGSTNYPRMIQLVQWMNSAVDEFDTAAGVIHDILPD